MPKHVSYDLMEQLHKTEEEVRLEAERVMEILEYFHSKVNTRKEIEK